MGKYTYYDPEENVIFCDPTGLSASKENIDLISDEVEEVARSILPRKVFMVVCYKEIKMTPELVAYYGERMAATQKHLRGVVRYAMEDIVTRIALRSETVKYGLQKGQAHIYSSKEEALAAVWQMERAGEGKTTDK